MPKAAWRRLVLAPHPLRQMGVILQDERPAPKKPQRLSIQPLAFRAGSTRMSQALENVKQNSLTGASWRLLLASLSQLL